MNRIYLILVLFVTIGKVLAGTMDGTGGDAIQEEFRRFGKTLAKEIRKLDPSFYEQIDPEKLSATLDFMKEGTLIVNTTEETLFVLFNGVETRVDAVSVKKPVRATYLNITTWNSLSCIGKYAIVLHEYFTFEGIEETKQTEYSEKIIEALNLTCDKIVLKFSLAFCNSGGSTLLEADINGRRFTPALGAAIGTYKCYFGEYFAEKDELLQIDLKFRPLSSTGARPSLKVCTFDRSKCWNNKLILPEEGTVFYKLGTWDAVTEILEI